MKIQFINENFVIVDKPHGMLSVPSRMGDEDPRPCVGKLLEQQTGGRIYPVHRLDFEVGGLIMFARNPEAHRAASGWFERHEIQKTYEALCTKLSPSGDFNRPTPQKTPLIWEARLVRGKKRAFEAPHGKPSKTRAWFSGPTGHPGISGGQETFLWRLEPVTGRSHQLRWEMSRHGMPILGDVLYGGESIPVPDFIALRAVRLDLTNVIEFRDFGLPEEGFTCESVCQWLLKLDK